MWFVLDENNVVCLGPEQCGLCCADPMLRVETSDNR